MQHNPEILLAVSNVALVVVAGVILAAAIGASVAMRLRRRSVWQEFAGKHRLHFAWNDGGPRIFGTTAGHNVMLETVDASSDTGALGIQEMQMSLQVECPTWPVGLSVESASNPVGDAEMHPVVTGDESFDRELLVTGSDRAAARGWLTDARQLALLNLAAEHRDKRVMLNGNRLRLQTRDAISRLAELDQMLESLVRAAGTIEIREEARRADTQETNSL